MTTELKSFYKSLITMALPIAIQQLITSLINMVDVFMIGKLGENEIAAVGLANQIFFLYTLLLFGINSGAAIFMAQFWGKKDEKNIHRIMGMCLSVSFVGAAVFMIGGAFMPQVLMRVYSSDEVVIALGAQYLRAVIISYAFFAISQTFNFALRCIGQTRIPMMITVLTLFMGMFFNYIFIYGNFGVPAFGVAGAGIATAITRGIEMLILVGIVYKYRFPVAGKIATMFSFNWTMLKDFFKTVGFVILNEIFWALGTSLYNTAYGLVGTQAQAAVQIASSVFQLFLVFSWAIGNSAAIMLGNLLGIGEYDKAILYSKRFYKIVTAVAMFLAVLILGSAPFIVGIFDVTDTVAVFARQILIVQAISVPLRCINHLNIVGILRSGGDTSYCLFLDISAVWLVGLPLVFVGAKFFQFPVYILVALASCEELAKIIFSVKRVHSKKWVRKVVQ